MTAELDKKITEQQGRKGTMVWHAGNHLREFLADYPQYETLISTDLDNPEMTLAKFEKKIHAAARENGNGLGGKAADAVLRKFFGLPETDEPEKNVPALAASGGAFDFGGGLW